MAPPSLTKTVHDRDSVRDTLDILDNELLNNQTVLLTETEVNHLLAMVKTAQTDIMDIHKQIQACAPADMVPQKQEYRQLFGRSLKLLSAYTGLKMAFPTSSSTSSSTSHSIPSGSKDIRLPRLELPTFDGNLSDWVSFRDMFVNAVHDNTILSKSQKLTYLKSQLKGEAYRQIQSMIISDANYDIAWSQLVDRYQNDRELLFAVLRRFIDQPIIQGIDSSAVRQLVDVSRECIRSLDVLQLPTDQWDAILMFHIHQKMDSTSKELWEQGLKDSSIPTLQSLFEFLEQRARALAASGFKSVQVNRDKSRNNAVRNVTHHTQSLPNCKLCSGSSHPLFKCQSFLAMSIQMRIEAIKKNNLCFNCLREGHSVSQCSCYKFCRTCGGKHNTLIHRNKPEAVATNSAKESQPPATRAYHTQQCSSQVPETESNSFINAILATAIVSVVDFHCQRQLCRVFLDNVSNKNYMTESCVNRLNLSRKRFTTQINGLGEECVGNTKGITSITFSPHFDIHTTLSVEVLIINKVTGKLPQSYLNHSQWSHLRNLQLADPYYNKPANIDILLGADIFYSIISNGKRTGPKGSPVAINSTLGWLVGGGGEAYSKTATAYHTSIAAGDQTDNEDTSSDHHLDNLLQRFWDIETLPNSKKLTEEEEASEQHFKTTYSRDKTGRFTVKLPFKSSQPNIGASIDIATRRFKQLERRLQLQPEYKKEYIKFMKDYENLGHMIEILPVDSTSNHCYIPHHFVLKESSTTTKFRVVFDASFKTANGKSLNEEMMVGPTIQDTLVDILMRFRLHKIAFTADIAKMYRQIKVQEEDTNMQLILWREDPSLPTKHYKLLTVTYGTASAPFLATRVLKELAILEQEKLPMASTVAQRDFYVDDVMSGAQSENEAIEITSQLMKLANYGGMELRKFTSNSKNLLESIPLELRETVPLQQIDLDPSVKSLGVYWNPQTDQFGFKISISSNQPTKGITKRKVLSEISKIFDPVGWLAPVLIRAKILMQEIWKLDVGWDDTLPVIIQEQWKLFTKDLMDLEKLKIDRCYNPSIDLSSSSHQKICLIGFSDASERAYSAVVYLCVYDQLKLPVISMITSKTRVAPIKQISVPRLELCGALLLSELIVSVKSALQIEIHSIQCWSDSTVVLNWIYGHPSRWKNFVANRVTKIQNRVPAINWGHVAGIDNPADCASRGIESINLFNHELWWRGPLWLTNGIPVPVRIQSSKDQDLDQTEEKREPACHTTHVIVDDPLLCKFSSLHKLKRVTAFMYRFINNVKARLRIRHLDLQQYCQTSGPINPVELENALQHWVRVTQQQYFNSEIKCITNQQPLLRSSKLLPLSPYLDNSQILRVGGRLKNSPLSPDQRNPMLLPRHSKLTDLIINQEHLDNFHAGPQLLMSTIQRRFWILRAKDAVRWIIRKCTICTRLRAETIQQVMADLPSFRVTPCRPFLSCGVDYAGPFLIRPIQPRSKITIKAYLAIFVCCTTRAVHLEVVSSLSTDAFIACIRRFIARRGLPTDMYSDCGSNFVGAVREMKEMISLVNSTGYNEVISNQLSRQSINWHFNPPASPHFGGLWEAGVKSVKHHLRRVMGSNRLTFEELSTTIAQIEAILNSRPLTPESSDPNDLIALTPGHFLIGQPLTSIVEPNLEQIKLNQLSRWQLLQQMIQKFWHRWSCEYISRMQQRPKWMSGEKKISVGDMVIIKDERLPPLQWRLGRVLHTHPGDDSVVRVVTLKTSDGEIKRPAVKLCLLPIEQNPSSSM